ncbi:uncharacterized protein J3R85_000498 [Psidium guajava]|nr:uncharacterized protein J3R85_000498 [Psidium guajava]
MFPNSSLRLLLDATQHVYPHNGTGRVAIVNWIPC